MAIGIAKGALPDPRKRLVERMQDLNFGRFENVPVRGGQPVLDPPPRVIREIKLGSDNGPRSESSAGDFLLKAQVVDLFDQLDRLQNGTILVLEVKHGLPFRMLIAESGN